MLKKGTFVTNQAWIFQKSGFNVRIVQSLSNLVWKHMLH